MKIEEVAQQLLDGCDPERLLAELRPKYTLQYFSNIVCRVKAHLVATNTRHPEYRPDLLTPFQDHPEIAAFLNAPLKEQEQIQKRHRKCPTWSKEAEAALQSLKLLPECLTHFKVSEAEWNAIRKEKEDAHAKRMHKPVRIPEAGRMLTSAIEQLQLASVTDSFPHLTLPLLLVSGRRLTELLNGRSTFRKASERSVHFYGQLKTPTVVEYEIPLLCPSDLFLHAFGILREKQGVIGGAGWSDEDVNQRYAGNLRRGMELYFPAVTHPEKKQGSPHLLRSIYAKFVEKLYDYSCTENYLMMRILGHADFKKSLWYMAVKLEGVANLQNSLGEWEVAE